MYTVPEKHQRKIAYRILRNETPLMASILGGMSFPEAYELIFHTDLSNRLDQLIKEHGIACKSNDFAWELSQYGWSPISLNNALGTLYSRNALSS